MTDVHESWFTGPYISAFFRSSLIDRSSSTRAIYERSLSAWITFCAHECNVPPHEVDYSRYTLVVFENSKFHLPIRATVTDRFLSDIQVPTVRKQAQRCLHAYFAWIVDHGFLAYNPVSKPKSTPKVPKQGLSEEEIQRLISAIQSRPIYARAPLLIQLAAGLRAGEVCALRLGDIEELYPGGWIVSIQREALKGRVAGCLPLPNVTLLMEEYLAWRNSISTTSDRLFINTKGRGLTVKYINQQLLDHVRAEANCSRHVSSHDLRRAYATLLGPRLTQPDTLKQFMRHKDIEVSLGYWRRAQSGDIRQHLRTFESVKLAEQFIRRDVDTLNLNIEISEWN